MFHMGTTKNRMGTTQNHMGTTKNRMKFCSATHAMGTKHTILLTRVTC